MTVSTTGSRKDYNGNGATTLFAADFYITDAAEVSALLTDIATGKAVTLAPYTDYTISNMTSSGFTATLSTAPATGQRLTLLRDMPLTQLTEYVENEDLRAETLQKDFDEAALRDQQLQEQIDRCLSYPATDTSARELPSSQARAGTLLAFDSSGNPVAGPQVASITNAQQYAELAEAAAMAIKNTYYGPLATDPTARPDGTAIQTGDLYFNTALGHMRIYDGAVWKPATTLYAPIVDTFTGDGNTKSFTLTAAPPSLSALFVSQNGFVKTPTADYTLSGKVITFTAAPYNNEPILVVNIGTGGAVETGVPDGSITYAKLATSSVTPIKMANRGAELGMRNRLINGAMLVNQRRAGITALSNGVFLADCWFVDGPQSGGFIGGPDSNNTIEEPHLYIKSTSAYSLGASDVNTLHQHLEGVNWEDMLWGTIDAKDAVLSFTVAASTAGNYGGAISNGDNTRAYPFLYYVPEGGPTRVSIAIPGDTSGTWQSGSAIGLKVLFGLAVGENSLGTAGEWANAAHCSAHGALSMLSSADNILRITDIQLESGQSATPFEYRQYGVELMLCQRYYQRYTGNVSGAILAGGSAVGTGTCVTVLPLACALRYPASAAYNNVLITDGVDNADVGGVTLVDTAHEQAATVAWTAVQNNLTRGHGYFVCANAAGGIIELISGI